MSAVCRSCKAPIVWMKTRDGKNAPADAASVTPEDSAACVPFDPKRHINHFATCPQSKDWKGKKR